jgi:hypothetical protein
MEGFKIQLNARNSARPTRRDLRTWDRLSYDLSRAKAEKCKLVKKHLECYENTVRKADEELHRILGGITKRMRGRGIWPLMECGPEHFASPSTLEEETGIEEEESKHDLGQDRKENGEASIASTKKRKLPIEAKNAEVIEESKMESPRSNEAMMVKKRKTELQDARHGLIVHQATYSTQLQEYKIEDNMDTSDGTSTAFGPIYVTRGRELTRKIQKAEDALEVAKRAAYQARVPHELDQESGFVSFSGDGYRPDDTNECENTCDRKRIVEWREDTRDVNGPTPSEIDNCEHLPEIEPWESISTVEECPRKRMKMMTWTQQVRDQRLRDIKKQRRASM